MFGLVLVVSVVFLVSVVSAVSVVFGVNHAVISVSYC